ncbi:MAG: GtrA family protein [Bacteroidaceae bacterium]|nr:GtrA family protein [Bacteroidaceae bacterium]
MNEKIKSLKENQKFLEFVKFCIVGGISTGIDACIFFTVKQFTIYQIALVSGYAISFIANYFMTVLWTFKSKPNKKNAIGVLAGTSNKPFRSQIRTYALVRRDLQNRLQYRLHTYTADKHRCKFHSCKAGS